jgi:predicted MFS family arabinose efflux permease
MTISHPASLKYALWDTFFFSLMVGAGETYLPAYALSVGMSEWLTGLFATVPLMSGAAIQMVSPWALYYVGSVKKWVVGAGVVQALSFLPLFFFTLFPTDNFIWLFLIAAVYWGATYASGPMWNFWMNQLVPEDQAAQFFARRHRVGQIGILIGLIGGGLALHANLHVGSFTSVFSTLFLVAFFSRASSSFCLSMKKEWKATPDHRPDVREVLNLFRSPAYHGFFSFLFIFYVTIFISSPFVTPYFLEKLHLTYYDYMFSLAALFVAKIAVLPFVTPLMKKYGVKRVFFWGALGISPLPALWPLSDSLWFVMALQAVSGAFWGMFEVSLSVTFFNQIHPKQKILVLTFYNFFNATAVIIGSLVGGQILREFHSNYASYAVIFMAGSILRCFVVGLYGLKTRHQKELLENPDGSVNAPNEEVALDLNAFPNPTSKHVKAG